MEDGLGGYNGEKVFSAENEVVWFSGGSSGLVVPIGAKNEKQ